MNIVQFTKEFNARTADKGDLIIPVVITVYQDRTFSFITKTPPAAVLLKKLSPTRLVKGDFATAVEEAEARGASVEELRELLGKGRAKKGIFEGDLKEGELEIGQVASLFWEELSVEEVMKELIRDFKRSLENVKTQLCS